MAVMSETRSHLPAFAALSASLLFASVAVAAPEAPAEPADPAEGGVDVLVLRVGGTGSASSAQRYIDDLMNVAAKVNGWPSAQGKYFTSKKLAENWIRTQKPHYGILSFSAYLGMRKAHDLSLLGKVDATAAGGQQYFIISVNQHDLAGCKGKTLGTNIDDAKFVDKVVAGDAFDLSDFEVVDTKRPVKTVKSVLRGETECALIDDAQILAMSKLEGAEALHTVWFSPTLPSLVVTKFGEAPDAEAKTFAKNLDKLCTGEGQEACQAAGIKELAPVAADSLDAWVAKYDG